MTLPKHTSTWASSAALSDSLAGSMTATIRPASPLKASSAGGSGQAGGSASGQPPSPEDGSDEAGSARVPADSRGGGGAARPLPSCRLSSSRSQPRRLVNGFSSASLHLCRNSSALQGGEQRGL